MVKRIIIISSILLGIIGYTAPLVSHTTDVVTPNSKLNPDSMAIKAIIELTALPGKRDELKAFIDDLVATHGPGGPGFIQSKRYEVLGHPDRLLEIAEWESAEARESHMKAAAASGIYAPLKDLLAEPFKVTIIRQMD